MLLLWCFQLEFLQSLDLGIELVLRCEVMEIESLRCIVRYCERVVVVRPKYVLFSSETQGPKGHLSVYMTFAQSRSSVEGKSFGN